MKRLVSWMIMVACLALLFSGCSPAAPAATSVPTTTAPAKAAEPTRSVDYPIKGKTINLLCMWTAGAAGDLGARLLAAGMEKELGTPVQVLNKSGASGQVAMSDLVAEKADGYTLLQTTQPASVLMYLDPSRKANFARKDFEAIGNYTTIANGIAVKSDSPYKSLKDLVEAARANPETIRVGDPGLLSGPHMGVLILEKVAGVKFASVHFSGGSQALTALLGGHVEAQVAGVSTFSSPFKSGELRILGLQDTVQDRLYPGVKTMAEQGYDTSLPIVYGLASASGAPKEVVDVLKKTFKKVVETGEFATKLEQGGSLVRYMDANEAAKQWDDMESQLKPLIPLAR